MSVPAARLVVVNSATPSVSVSLPSVPLWSLKVTVPPFGNSTARGQVADSRDERDRLPDRPPKRSRRLSAVSVGSARRRGYGHGHRRRDLANDVVVASAIEQVARGIDGDAEGAASSAAVAGPLSPL